MYNYRAYGLGIHSELPLPELLSVPDAPPDVSIRFGEIPPKLQSMGSAEGGLQLSKDGASFVWNEIGSFSARDGNEITVDPAKGVEDSLLRYPLLGVVFASLLHQRGLPVLHASCVVIGGEAIAFVGDKGFGKSTIAAHFRMYGHELITDDVLSLDLQAEGGPMAIPGFPQIRLWPDAIASIGEDPERLPLISTKYEKRTYRIKERFPDYPAPLKRIYVLGTGDDAKIQPLPPRDALMEVMKTSFVFRFGSQLPISQQASNFQQFIEITNSVPVYRLIRPNSLELIPAIVELVENHLAVASADEVVGIGTYS